MLRLNLRLARGSVLCSTPGDKYPSMEDFPPCPGQAMKQIQMAAKWNPQDAIFPLKSKDLNNFSDLSCSEYFSLYGQNLFSSSVLYLYFWQWATIQNDHFLCENPMGRLSRCSKRSKIEFWSWARWRKHTPPHRPLNAAVWAEQNVWSSYLRTLTSSM